jgi:hypothetical protein
MYSKCLFTVKKFHRKTILPKNIRLSSKFYNQNPMGDKEKAKAHLKIVGIKRAKAMYAVSGEEAVYPGAIISESNEQQVVKRLLKRQKPSTIIKHVDVCLKTVETHRNRLFGFKSKKPNSVK